MRKQSVLEVLSAEIAWHRNKLEDDMRTMPNGRETKSTEKATKQGFIKGLEHAKRLVSEMPEVKP